MDNYIAHNAMLTEMMAADHELIMALKKEIQTLKKEIQTLKEQPAQEPLDVARVQEDGYVEWNPDLPDLPVGTKLYTHPAPAWQGLSITERVNVIKSVYEKFEGCGADILEVEIARAIEQALKDKNSCT